MMHDGEACASLMPRAKTQRSGRQVVTVSGLPSILSSSHQNRPLARGARGGGLRPYATALTMSEVTPSKTKKPCKFGAKCKKRHRKFDHPTAGAAARDSRHETNQRGDSTTSQHQDDSICLPLNVSVLLQSLTKTNETMIEAITSNACMISKLQSENAQLMNVAQGTQRDLQLLQEQVTVHLKDQQQRYNEKLVALSQDAAKEKETARRILQTNARHAKHCIKKEREISQITSISLKSRS